MSNEEYINNQVDQTEKYLSTVIRHIKLIQDACHKLGMRLIENGEADFGKLLIANSFIHDNSKFYGIEWEYLNNDATKEQLALAHKQHVTTNPHHPEYWGDVNSMPRIYVAEMICDWKARSDEFGSDLKDWIKNSAFERYGIPKSGKIAKQIKEFLNLLLEKPFNQIA